MTPDPRIFDDQELIECAKAMRKAICNHYGLRATWDHLSPSRQQDLLLMASIARTFIRGEFMEGK